MIKISSHVFVPEAELKLSFIRSPGPGGQNVNKVATAVLLRFNINQSSMPALAKERLLLVLANKLTQEGDIIIKAVRFRTQERNKQDAIERLQVMLKQALIIPKKRKKTKPTKASTERRLQKKKLHGKTKLLRRKQDE